VLLVRGALLLVLVVGCGLRDGAYMAPHAGGDPPPPSAIDHRLILIGDAGDPDPMGEPTLRALEAQVRVLPARTTVVFLGDNVYETGMPDATDMKGTSVEEALDQTLLNLYSSRQDAERRLKAQVKAVDTRGARAIFVPGNHDWDQFGVGGWKRVREQETYIDTLAKTTDVRLSMLPGGGCPGPITRDLGRRARLIVLDTQWLLELGDKPSPENNPTGCAQTTTAEVSAAIVAALREAKRDGRAAIVVAHHPLRSHGPHGGYVSPRIHLFPLTMFGSYVPGWSHWIPIPLLGSAMGLGRAWFSPNVQDFSSSVNEDMRETLWAAMDAPAVDGAAPLLYAAGHEHSLQIFESDRGPRYLVVSGLGSSDKATPVGRDSSSLFADAAHERSGFMTLDFLRDGRTRLAVVEVGPEQPEGVEVWAQLLGAEHGSMTRRAAGENPTN
jgi:hypothetical protein